MEPNSSENFDEWENPDPQIISAPPILTESKPEKPVQLFTALSHADILQRLQNLLNQCKETLCISHDEALLILLHYKWNWLKIQEEWFMKEDLIRLSCGLKSALPVDKSDPTYCPICCSQITAENSDALKCKHFFCANCWKMYLQTELTKGKNFIFVKCPYEGCEYRVLHSIIKKYLDKSNFDKFENFLLMSFTDDNKALKWCPREKCGYIIENFGPSKTEVTCKCGYSFCHACSIGSHMPATCEMIKKWLERSKSEGANLTWIKAYTKACPSCKKFIEKNQGCNHMTCSQCKHQFCWICMGDWATHGGYSCNKVDKSLILEATTAKNEIQRYMFYYERVENHMKSITEIEKRKYNIYDFTVNLHQIKGIPIDDLCFFQDAIDVLKLTHKLLSNSYIFGFYLKSVKEINLFEFIQKDLEHYTFRLNELLESDKNYFLDINDLTNMEFCNYKGEIMGISTALNKIYVKFLDGLKQDFSDYQ